MGVNSEVKDCLVRLCHQRRRSRLKNLLGYYARWTGSSRTLRNCPMQAVGVGRTPESERGHQDQPVFLPYQERTGNRLAKDQETLMKW